MKKIFLLITGFFSLIPAAFADHHAVFISSIIKLSDTDCAIELEISDDDQDAFTDDDRVELNGVEIFDLSEVVDAGINDSNGNNDDGDTILAASTFFASSHDDITPDITFDNDVCEDLDDDAVISYFTDDEADAIAEIDTDDVDGFGSDSSAIIQASSAGVPEAVDLTEESVTIGNNSNDSITLGEGEEEVNGLTCSLSKNSKAPVAVWWFATLWFAALPLFFFVFKKAT